MFCAIASRISSPSARSAGSGCAGDRVVVVAAPGVGQHVRPRLASRARTPPARRPGCPGRRRPGTGAAWHSGAIANTFADSPVPWPCGSRAGLVPGIDRHRRLDRVAVGGEERVAVPAAVDHRHASRPRRAGRCGVPRRRRGSWPRRRARAGGSAPTDGGIGAGKTAIGERGRSSTTPSMTSRTPAPAPRLRGLARADDVQVGDVLDPPAARVHEPLERLHRAAGQLLVRRGRPATAMPSRLSAITLRPACSIALAACSGSRP